MARDLALQSDSSREGNAARDFRLTIPAFAAQQSLRAQTADSLRAALVSGQMRPGVVYSVPVLADRFGISATPVREAMLDLAKEGLFEPVRNKGFRVTELSDKELDDITHLRSLIEVPTVTKSRRDRSAESHTRASAPGQSDRRRGGRGRSHRLSGDGPAVPPRAPGTRGQRGDRQGGGDLRARTRLYGLERLAQQERLAASAAEHQELLDALLARDAPRVERIMRRHLAHVRGIWADRPED